MQWLFSSAFAWLLERRGSFSCNSHHLARNPQEQQGWCVSAALTVLPGGGSPRIRLQAVRKQLLCVRCMPYSECTSCASLYFGVDQVRHLWATYGSSWTLLFPLHSAAICFVAASGGKGQVEGASLVGAVKTQIKSVLWKAHQLTCQGTTDGWNTMKRKWWRDGIGARAEGLIYSN